MRESKNFWRYKRSEVEQWRPTIAMISLVSSMLIVVACYVGRHDMAIALFALKALGKMDDWFAPYVIEEDK